jgi:hypothetical protein
MELPPDRSSLAAHAEMQDAAALQDSPTATVFVDYLDAPGAATLEIAKVLTVFEDRIHDEWRADLIGLGGALLRLDRALKANSDG